MAVKHSSRSHAKLSASSSARWMACPPSAKLNAEIPDVATDYAREGTCAHELAEFKVNRLLGIESADPTENLDYFDQEMADCTDDYAQYIAEQISKYSDPQVLVEQRLDFSKYVPDGFGTGDCVIVANEVLTVIDYKHGKGVAVSAEHNSQMMLYALGALELFSSSSGFSSPPSLSGSSGLSSSGSSSSFSGSGFFSSKRISSANPNSTAFLAFIHVSSLMSFEILLRDNPVFTA